MFKTLKISILTAQPVHLQTFVRGTYDDNPIASVWSCRLWMSCDGYDLVQALHLYKAYPCHGSGEGMLDERAIRHRKVMSTRLCCQAC